MKFGITGASSDIGKALNSFLTLSGHQVVKFGRQEENYWELGKELPESDIELLFHLAHDRSFTLENNRRATDLLVSSCKKKIVYISSTSAHPNSLSNYGKSKYLIQEKIKKSGGVVVVAGLIFGQTQMSESSMVTKLTNIVTNSPFVLVPFRGESKLYFSKINALSQALYLAAKESEHSIIKAFSNSSLSLYDFLNLLGSEDEDIPRIFKFPNLGASSFLKLTSQFVTYPDPIDSLLSLVNEIPLDYIRELHEIPGLEFPVYR